MKFISHSPKQTQAFAKKILKNLKDQNILALYGDLGSGKTTFVQGLGQALGISERILSPTYIIQRTYPLSQGKPFKRFYHLDLYRLKSPEDLKSIDLSEIINDPKNLVAIEWAEKAESDLPPNSLKLKFKSTGDKQRTIDIKP